MDNAPPAPAPAPPAKTPPQSRSASRRLPPELVSLVVELTQDWELAHALGVRTALPVPAPWQEFATPLDRAILRAATTSSLVPVEYARLVEGHTALTQFGARVMLRLSLVDVLDYLLREDEQQLRYQCQDLLPVVASAWGRLDVLQWAKNSRFGLSPSPRVTAEAIDEASRHGQVQSASLPLSPLSLLRLVDLLHFRSARLLARVGHPSPCVRFPPSSPSPPRA